MLISVAGVSPTPQGIRIGLSVTLSDSRNVGGDAPYDPAASSQVMNQRLIDQGKQMAKDALGFIPGGQDTVKLLGGFA